MDNIDCTVVYLDRRAKETLAKKEQLPCLAPPQSSAAGTGSSKSSGFSSEETMSSWSDNSEMQNNVKSLLSVFGEVHLHRTGTSCIDKISSITRSAKASAITLVLLDVPHDQRPREYQSPDDVNTPSPTSLRVPHGSSSYFDAGELYGINVIDHITNAFQSKFPTTLVLPFAIISGTKLQQALEPWIPHRFTRYIDSGAVDVLVGPLSDDQVQRLSLQAYKAYKDTMKEEKSLLIDKRARKLSWVGVEETKPYAYLREAMVSGLMGGICNPDSMSPVLAISELEIIAERREAVSKAVGGWDFNGHDFTDDELTYGAFVMLQHALQMPELERWRMPDDDLMKFLHASREAYNDFVLYHNFRHVCDVLQAVFFFLVQMKVLPAYRGVPSDSAPRPPLSNLLKPSDALCLLISAVGHDVGHPGVNNAFLVALNAPLAQLYNDRSVLESFHCAAYSQILRRHWPSAFQDSTMRKLMINSILATDMGLHFKYMGDLAGLQKKLKEDDNIQEWQDKQKEDSRDLLCGLLIKCADISNVGRQFVIAAQWASILSDEFSNQGNMEVELNIPTQLFGGPPERDNLIKMAESQIGFMNIFARPLFNGVTEVLPCMDFGINQIDENRKTWQGKIDALTSPNGVSPLDGTTEETRSPSSERAAMARSKTEGDRGTHVSGPPATFAVAKQSTASEPNQAASQKKARLTTAALVDTKLRSASSPQGHLPTSQAAADRPRSSPVKGRLQAPPEPPPSVPRFDLSHSRSQPDVRSPTSTNGSAEDEGDLHTQLKGSMQIPTGANGVGNKRSSRLGAGLSKFLRMGRRKPASAPMVLPESESERQKLAETAQENAGA